MTPPLPTEPQEMHEAIDTLKPPYKYTKVTDARIKKAHDRISDLCHKRREWLPLRVPADREWDNDLLFGSIIRDLKYERDLAEDRLKPVTESEIRELAIKTFWPDGPLLDTEIGRKIHNIRERQAEGFVVAARLFGKVAQ